MAVGRPRGGQSFTGGFRRSIAFSWMHWDHTASLHGNVVKLHKLAVIKSDKVETKDYQMRSKINTFVLRTLEYSADISADGKRAAHRTTCHKQKQELLVEERRGELEHSCTLLRQNVEKYWCDGFWLIWTRINFSLMLNPIKPCCSWPTLTEFGAKMYFIKHYRNLDFHKKVRFQGFFVRLILNV